MQKFKKDKALSAIFTSFSHTHHGTNAINLGLVKHGGAVNSAWQAFAGKTTHDKFGLASVAKMVLADKTMCGSITNSAQRKWGSVWAGDFSLSLLALSSILKFKHFI